MINNGKYKLNIIFYSNLIILIPEIVKCMMYMEC